MEGDVHTLVYRQAGSIFQSTPSAWRETYFVIITIALWSNFNPLPPHGGRQKFRESLGLTMRISIHSLRMEGDFRCFQNILLMFIISIHSLRMEGDAIR